MAALERRDFAAFFEQLWGYAPRAWQVRLLDHLLDEGQWPQHITAPTGSGKSAVVDIHIFANALARAGSGVRIPLRLAVCVNRRSIVDQHEARARHITAMLEGATAGVLARVKDAVGPVVVANLRGGQSVDREWIDDVTACSVITITPDMWGSRVLFHGYGTTRAAAARDAGLLAMDAVFVCDEAHMSRQVCHTARQIAEMTRDSALTIGVPGLQVVEISATPQTTHGIQVEPDEIAHDEGLRRVIEAPKSLTYLVDTRQVAKSQVSDAYIKMLAKTALDLPVTTQPATVGIVVNRVDTAVRVADELKRHVDPDSVVSWVGRMREMDLDAMRDDYPGIDTISGNPSVRFLVATQTIEVGVDIDLAGMVTEIAPAASLVQRAGRVNRLGLRSDAPIVVVGPDGPAFKDNLPYLSDDLAAAWSWLSGRTSLSPADITNVPATSLSRAVITTLHEPEVELLAATSNKPIAPADLAYWIRESLEADTDAYVVMRHHLPADDGEAIELLRATKPVAREMFPVPISKIGELINSRPRAFMVTADGDIRVCETSPRPGDVFIIDAASITVGNVVGLINDETKGTMPTCLWPLVSPQDIRPGVLVEVGALEDDEHDELNIVMTTHYAVVTSVDDVVASPEDRQRRSPTTAVVTLDAHSHAVATRSYELGIAVGMPDDLANALWCAGLSHDAGKADPRFQREVLGNTDKHLVLAKSTRKLGKPTYESLPMGWRHEQASVPYAVLEHHDSAHLDLIARLVGTSHGRGRNMFPHDDTSLGLEGELGQIAHDLFSTGAGWMDIIEETNLRYGVWGCAYLEAVLRSADCMVSKEGS